jgi:hypothetical protein
MFSQEFKIDGNVTHKARLQTIIIEMVHMGDVRSHPVRILRGIETRNWRWLRFSCHIAGFGKQDIVFPSYRRRIELEE